ncbi:hypothetical protein E4U38_000825 [Claviceps purpurea]|nr:hypothetical protein E4U38_000825 [Claviceps purpurea]
MSGVLSKRQQARNEKALQDLVHNIPGNNQCADCHARNPEDDQRQQGDAFGGHKLTLRQNMRKVGNVASNQIYNPESKRPPVPVDVDEADSAMERFIRQKYIHNVATESRKSRSPRSDEGIPPPLPPKNSTKFGFRSASSIFPLSSRVRKEHRDATILSDGDVDSSTLANKPSRLFGSAVDYDGTEDLDRKVARLREMGFQDSQRNAIVLKGVNGDMNRAIEALVRLGEGRSRSPGPAPPPRDPVLRSVKSMTPLTSRSSSPGLGLSLNVPPKPSNIDRPATSSTASTNPFDMMAIAQPQTAQSTGSLHHKNPYSDTNNPFGQPAHQVDLVGPAFQSLGPSSSQPTSFPPNHAGVMSQIPSPQILQQQQQQQQHQQHMLTSGPTGMQQYQPITFQNNAIYPQIVPQMLQPMQTGYNPFLSRPSGPTSLPQSTMVGSALGNSVNNPYARSPAIRLGSPTLGQIPEQATSSFTQSPPFMTTSPQHSSMSTNPFFLNNPLQQMPLEQQQQLPPQQVQQATSISGHQAHANQQLYLQHSRYDKASILALYNQPGSNFHPQAAAEPNPAITTPSIPNGEAFTAQPTQHPVMEQQSHSVSQRPPGNNNPFMSETMATQARHISRESMNLGLDMSWTNGRHSPDAFASLSARHA